MMDRLDETIKILKALSDVNRIRIVCLLKHKKDICVCEITEIIGLAQPTISSHLKILENAGLIYSVKDGKWVNYRLNTKLKNKIKDLLDNILLTIKDSRQIISDKKKAVKG